MGNTFIYLLISKEDSEEFGKQGIFTSLGKAKAAIGLLKAEHDYTICKVKLNKKMRSIHNLEKQIDYKITKINCNGKEVTYKEPLFSKGRYKGKILILKQIYQICYLPGTKDELDNEIAHTIGYFRNQYMAKQCIEKTPILPETYSIACFPLNKIFDDFKFALCLEIPKKNIEEKDLYVLIRRQWK